MYTTTEGQEMVELCAVVTSHPGGAPRAFTISATTRDGTAGSVHDMNMKYRYKSFLLYYSCRH